MRKWLRLRRGLRRNLKRGLRHKLLRISIATFLGLVISFCGSGWPVVPFSGSLSGFYQPAIAQRTAIPSADSQSSPQSPSQLTLDQREQQARQLYLDGEFSAAIALWKDLAQSRAAQQNYAAQASALSNLSLARQQLGHWADAQAAVTASLQLVAQLTVPEQQIEQAKAQALMAQGSLQMALGRSQQSLETWQQAEMAYRQSGDVTGSDRARINQAQALRELGFYRQALEQLTGVMATMANQPPSPLKAITLRRLGEILRLSGQLTDAQTALTQSLAIARVYDLPIEVSATLLSLGYTAYDQGDIAAAQDFYQQAMISLSDDASAHQRPLAAQLMPIQLAQLALSVKTAQWPAAAELWPTIQSQFDSLPPSRTAIYHQVNWAHSLIKLKQANATSLEPSWMTIAQQLRRASQQAHSLGDIKAEAYATGTLGQVYEQTQQWAMAQDLTQQALSLSYSLGAEGLIYQWQWQLGRLWQAPGNPQQSRQKALDAYRRAIATLAELRGDLAAVGDSAQFSFREDVEPVYRQLVGLLLRPEPDGQTISQANLASAQAVIESLRLAELDDYFREACADIQPININEVDPKAAIVYSIVLEDQLAVILRLPHQPLQSFTTMVSASTVAQTTAKLRQQLVIRSRREYFASAEVVYQWLIDPARATIDSSGVNKLVFVLDGPLQSLPMAALYDGHHFLIEDYGVALTPGLQLLNPQPWETEDLNILVAGLTESRLGRSPLPYVTREIEEITATLPHNTVLLNRNFTHKTLPESIASNAYPIVHIATHGQFGATPEETYLIAWDDRIDVRELSQMLQARPLDDQSIELLVLSACETASGDQRAALGLAGVAIKAGARSTLATLWAINDEATAQFVGYLYRQLTQPGATRSGALRAAQVQMLQDPQYQHPIYWAPYVLLGSWL